MSKKSKIIVGITSTVLVLILIFVVLYYSWPLNRVFYDLAKQEFEIPGLDSKFTPQGMADMGDDKFIISGYMTDGSPSRFYVINKGTIEKYFTLKDNADNVINCASGLVCRNNIVWIVGNKKCYTISVSAISSVENSNAVNIVGQFDAINNADFVYVSDNTLWIGEYYSKNNVTSKTHWLENRSGEMNHALAFGYQINEGRSTGVTNTIPTKALSISDNCQGIDVASDGRLVMSCSEGKTDSKIKLFKKLENVAPDKFIFGVNQVDLWYLDGKNLLGEVIAPNMSENIVVKNNFAYILFRSGAKENSIFNRNRIKNVYSIAIDSLIN